jgi:hypothetical protein
MYYFKIGNILIAGLSYHHTERLAFQGFGQAKFPDGGLVLGSSQFSILPQLPPKILLNLKVVASLV